jgi:hypothetical protein
MIKHVLARREQEDLSEEEEMIKVDEFLRVFGKECYCTK